MEVPGTATDSIVFVQVFIYEGGSSVWGLWSGADPPDFGAGPWLPRRYDYHRIEMRGKDHQREKPYRRNTW